MPASYEKFTSQMDLGKYLTAQYHIRNAEGALELRDVPPMMKTTGNNATGIGTEQTMAETKAPAGQPVVVTQICAGKDDAG